MKITHFIGIDVSKNTLDICILNTDGASEHFQILNNTKSIKTFLTKQTKKNSGFKNSLFCMEATGIYGELLLKCLTERSLDTWVVNPVHIKRSIGMVRGKSDKIDSFRIAQFAERHKNEARLFKPVRPIIKKLRALSRVREQLVKARTQLRQSLTESKFEDPQVVALKRQALETSVLALSSDIKNIEKQMTQIIQQDENLAKTYKITSSVIGIGPVSAVEIIVITNEFKTITEAKKFACHSGVAPFPNSSGTSLKGKHRVSQLANKKMKRLLHLAALSAIRYHNEIRLYYLKKVAEGKHKMSVLNAVRNKIINRLFACIKQGKLYDINLQVS